MASPFPEDDGRGPLGVEFRVTGFRYPGRRGRREYLAYRDVLHTQVTARGLRLSTPSGGVTIASPRGAGDEGHADAQALSLALRARIGLLPDGPERGLRMHALDRLVDRVARPRLTLFLLLVCALVHGAQLVSESVTHLGALRPALLGIEPWRLVTGQFLHAVFVDVPGPFSPHLVLNALGLWVLGSLVERQVGLARTGLVVAGAALGAAWASAAAGYHLVIGASGWVLGLAGALLALEFARGGQVPAGWRLPRVLLVLAVAADLLLTSRLPGVAGAAHLGGFLGGALMLLAITRRAPWEGPLPKGVALLARVNAAALVLAFAAWGAVLAAPDGAALRRARLLLEDERSAPGILNDEAWMIAISDEPGSDLLRIAERMAERAVAATGRRSPDLLDTLAEIRFLLGDEAEATAIIEEAILLSPGVSYYREQRRRFLGDRAPDDRPPPPGSRPERPEEEPTPPRKVPDDEDAILVQHRARGGAAA